MRSAIIVAAVAGVASAQSTACAAQNIVDSCLTTTKIPLDACAPNDWQCMCDAQTSVVTCYNNCPGDQNKFAAQQQQIAWCNAAAQFAPSSTRAASTLSTATSTAASASESTEASSASGSASARASASATGSSNAAAGLAAPVTGLLAVALGFLGLL